MAQGRSTKMILMNKWIRTSRLSIRNSLSKSVTRNPEQDLDGFEGQYNLGQCFRKGVGGVVENPELAVRSSLKSMSLQYEINKSMSLKSPCISCLKLMDFRPGRVRGAIQSGAVLPPGGERRRRAPRARRQVNPVTNHFICKHLYVINLV